MSQFTIYSSGDPGGDAPGTITGQVGDLIRVLDKVLVDGYTGKAAAGWTHPVPTAGNIASYKSASPANSGNGFGLVINDNGPNVTSTYKEAWATGFETVVTVAAPCGTGFGQFPLILTSGHLVIRKSSTADGVGRPWIILADDLTFYLFILTNDTAGAYFPFFFGDFFALAGAADTFRCMIAGRAIENSAAAGAANGAQDMVWPLVAAAPPAGLYMPRSYGGGAGSVIQGGLVGDASKNTGLGVVQATVGTLASPNGPDNAYYLTPFILSEVVGKLYRGRIRGLYYASHPLASFADGQTFSGAGQLAGKTFQVILKGINNGMWIVETSDTVETN